MSENGSAPGHELAELAARAQKGIDDHIRDLRALIQAEVDSRSEYERLVELSKQRERRLAKAVAALEGEPLHKPKTGPAKPKARQMISAEAADRVFDQMRNLMQQTGRDTVTRPQLMREITDMSGETIRRSLVLLRDQQRIRQAGRTGRGAATLYAVMPDAQD
jgi:predicted HTH transcriptional regulator